jgi:hypothetical protein
VGIAKGGARLLLAEAAKRQFSGRILQLGRQHLFLTSDDLFALAKTHGVRLNLTHVSKNARPPLLKNEYLDDGSFFAYLGFECVDSCDVSDDEKPTHILDLNRPLPPELVGKYDVIFDGGTLEHVFDFPQALRNIHQLLTVNGRIIHQSPSTNHVDHGFYMFSPTVFSDYYSVNGYEILELQLIEYERKFHRPWIVYNYVPGCLNDVCFGGFDRGKMLLISVVARKTDVSTWDVIPQQGWYLRRWRDDKFSRAATNQFTALGRSVFSQYEGNKKLPSTGLLQRLLRRLNRFKPYRVLDGYRVDQWSESPPKIDSVRDRS